MVQLIGIPGVQYPNNARIDFAPLTNALHTYRQGGVEAQQWDISRRAGERAAAGDLEGAAAEFYRGGMPTQGVQMGQLPLQRNALLAQTAHTAQQTELLRAQVAQARIQQQQDAEIARMVFGMGRGAAAQAPAASSTAPPVQAQPPASPSPNRAIAPPSGAGIGVAMQPVDQAGGRIPHLPGVVAPEAPSVAPPQQQPAANSPAGGFGGVIGNLPREQQLAAYLLWRGRKWEELGKLLQGGPETLVTQNAAQARGKALGEAQAGLPQAIQSGQGMIRNIDAVITDPNLTSITGASSAWWNPWAYAPAAPSTQGTIERINQVQGQAFLQAFQALKGGGAITEQEGAKAQAAMTRLANTSQSESDYQQALFDARREIWDLMNLARRRAGQQDLPYQPHASEPTRGVQASGGDGFSIRRID